MRRMCRPAATASFTVTRSPSRVAFSWISTVSAPSGITLPVNRRTQVPGSTRPPKGCPAGAVPTMARTLPGTASPARTA